MNLLPSPYHYLDAALHLAYSAAALIRKERGSGQVASHFKAARDIVTETDLRVEQFLTKQLLKRFPDSRIMGEETAPTADNFNGVLWVLDPIDGTTNYARGHHDVAVSIACIVDGSACCGVVLNPFAEECYYAIRNEGAYSNFQPLQIPRESRSLHEALIGIGRPFKQEDISNYFRRVEHVFQHTHGIRRQGAGALDICRVAAGRLDAFFETLNPWDVAAGLLIAQEAGCRILRTEGYQPTNIPVDIDGNNLLVSHPGIAQEVSDLLASVPKSS